MVKRKFISLERINKEMFNRQFLYRRNWFKLVGGLSLMSLSFVVPDLCIGLVIGLMVLSPIKLKHQLRNKTEDLKFNLLKLKVRCGLI